LKYLLKAISRKRFSAAFANQDSFSLMNVHLDKLDVSPALKRLAARLAMVSAQ
jgi:hypothetical protein